MTNYRPKEPENKNLLPRNERNLNSMFRIKNRADRESIEFLLSIWLISLRFSQVLRLLIIFQNLLRHYISIFYNI